MALRRFEGFEAYASLTEYNQQSNTNAGNFAEPTTSQSRTGSRSMNLKSSGYCRWNVTLSGSTIIVGIGVRVDAFTQVSMPIRMVSTSTSRGAMMVGIDSLGRLYVGSGASNSITFTNSAPASTLWTDTDTQPLDTWIHLEFKVVLASSATGSWSLKRNGALLQSQSSVQTLQNGADVVDLVVSNTGASNGNTYIDDPYICDGSGSDNNDFLGPVRVAALRPTANDSVAMTPSSGANWQCVDETTPNDDTDYVSAPASGLPLTDRYTMSDLPAEASLVRAVRTLYRARKEDAALVELRSLVRSGGSESLGTTRAIDTSYTFYADLFETDPSTGVAWTPSGVNGMTAGVRRVT